MIQAYPLQWPDGWQRAESHEQSRFGDHTLYQARSALKDEVWRLDGEDLIISSDLRVRADGGFVSKQRRSDDPGVAVYFIRDGQQEVIANDTYTTIEDNLWGIALTIGAMRGIERWGCSDILRRAFRYEALPDPHAADFRSVLGLDGDFTADDVAAAYRRAMKDAHPDRGGTDAQAIAVRGARDAALASLNGRAAVGA